MPGTSEENKQNLIKRFKEEWDKKDDAKKQSADTDFKNKIDNLRNEETNRIVNSYIESLNNAIQAACEKNKQARANNVKKARESLHNHMDRQAVGYEQPYAIIMQIFDMALQLSIILENSDSFNFMGMDISLSQTKNNISDGLTAIRHNILDWFSEKLLRGRKEGEPILFEHHFELDDNGCLDLANCRIDINGEPADEETQMLVLGSVTSWLSNHGYTLDDTANAPGELKFKLKNAPNQALNKATFAQIRDARNANGPSSLNEHFEKLAMAATINSNEMAFIVKEAEGYTPAPRPGANQ